jgi:medium-chain acyl-[acyl-carrier-protein] hydrolase
MQPIESNSPWIIFPKSYHPLRLRLFCFHYAGGNASIFRSWSEDLPPTIQVCAIELPGRQSRIAEPPFARMPRLVEALAQALCPFLDIPYAFFGHSMGALISFELVRQLRRQNHMGPVHLFAASCRAPHLAHTHYPIHTLSESSFLIALNRIAPAPKELLQNSELRQLIMPTLRADVALCETYTFTKEEPLNCPISIFGGTRDWEVSRTELSAWQCQTRGEFKLRQFADNHLLNSARSLLLQSICEDLSWLLS